MISILLNLLAECSTDTNSTSHYIHMWQPISLKVTRYIIRELTTRRELREQAIAAKKDKARPYRPLQYAHEHDVHRLTAQSSIACYPNTCKKIPNNRDVENSLCGLKLHKANDESRCVTWLELYTLFRLHGYNKPIINPADPADRRATLDKQIRSFKNSIREQARRTLSEEHAELFKPGRTIPGNLVGVGLLGRHAGPNFCIASDQATRDQIAQELVLMRHSIGVKKAHEYVLGNKGIAPIKLIIKGKIGWDNSFKVSQHQRNDTPWRGKNAA